MLVHYLTTIEELKRILETGEIEFCQIAVSNPNSDIAYSKDVIQKLVKKHFSDYENIYPLLRNNMLQDKEHDDFPETKLGLFYIDFSSSNKYSQNQVIAIAFDFDKLQKIIRDNYAPYLKAGKIMYSEEEIEKEIVKIKDNTNNKKNLIGELLNLYPFCMRSKSDRGNEYRLAFIDSQLSTNTLAKYDGDLLFYNNDDKIMVLNFRQVFADKIVSTLLIKPEAFEQCAHEIYLQIKSLGYNGLILQSRE